MNYMLIGSTLLHTVSNGFGIFANSLLIFLVLKKTPRCLATYSILILNFGVCDLLTCVSALFVQQRIIPGGLGLYYFSYGPCKYIGSVACYVAYSFLLHCYSHSLHSLMFSFSYRYYILSNGTPKVRTVIIISVLLYLPTVFQFVSFSFASDNVDEVKDAIAARFDYNMSDECVSGHLNILEWKTLFTILNMTITVAPDYVAILLLIRAIVSKLNTVKTMSGNYRQLHSQLLKALTYQACLPIFFIFAVLTYSIGQLNLYHHPTLEYSTFILAGFVPVLSPLTSFRFIHPYRSWIRKELLRRHTTAAIVSETSISVLHRSFDLRPNRRDLWNSH